MQNCRSFPIGRGPAPPASAAGPFWRGTRTSGGLASGGRDGRVRFWEPGGARSLEVHRPRPLLAGRRRCGQRRRGRPRALLGLGLGRPSWGARHRVLRLGRVSSAGSRRLPLARALTFQLPGSPALRDRREEIGDVSETRHMQDTDRQDRR